MKREFLFEMFIVCVVFLIEYNTTSVRRILPSKTHQFFLFENLYPLVSTRSYFIYLEKTNYTYSTQHKHILLSLQF
jgi:hypothetical protein